MHRIPLKLLLSAMFLVSSASLAHERVPAHRHTASCTHVPAPPVAPVDSRYELRPIERWVPGHYQQTWVEPRCKPSRWGKKPHCRGGYYDQRWVPGHYETVQQWVRVPAPLPPPPPSRVDGAYLSFSWVGAL